MCLEKVYLEVSHYIYYKYHIVNLLKQFIVKNEFQTKFRLWLQDNYEYEYYDYDDYLILETNTSSPSLALKINTSSSSSISETNTISTESILITKTNIISANKPSPL
ncbi:hypothetical protein F8M41_005424 [Gigaspora margarita]|uniref:Uncharacterized protein n=1 Tax=Gigaspora margarita TaxID=4874 RepID=A0A8H4AX94_GIGMA|nr:hypothetical protein F8M41_005424 [Gigaspora margarita]